MSSASEHALDALATYRLTKLVIDDEVTAELRDAAYTHLNNHPGKLSKKLTYFLSCPWCVSIWAGAAITVTRVVSPRAANAISGLLAASAVTGLLYERF